MNREQAKIWSKLSKAELRAIGQGGLAEWYKVMEHFANGGDVERKDQEYKDRWLCEEYPEFREDERYCIKPRTHIVNGFEVPAPIKEYTGPRTVYVPHFWSDGWSDEITGAGVIKRLIERRAAFETREAARANTMAMLGVDPRTYKEQAE